MMNRSPFRFLGNELQRYTLYGAVFGLTFPIAATILKIIILQLPFSLSSAIYIQKSDPVLWIVDTAPIVLGFFAALAGRRQDILLRQAAELGLREKNLEEYQATLENRVKERTAELDIANHQAQARTTQLKIITELLQTIAIVQNPEELLPLIARQISERFGFYHVGLFLLDDRKEFAVLRASNSDGGKRMLDRRHQLKVGGAGIVGFVAQSGRPRVASDTGADALFFNNPDLPDTHSEASVPLKIGEEVIGVVDVQSTQAFAFNHDDVEILNTLANQVAIVIQNTRLFEQLRSTLQSYTKTGYETWQENTSGYAYLPNGTVKTVPPANNEMIKSVPPSDQTIIMNSGSDGSVPSFAIAVKLRDQIVGIINIEATEANRKWSDDEIAMVQAISERAALALENARLFEETSRRAEHEKVVSQITSRISESTNFDRILQTTIQELGRSLGASRTFIQLETQATNGKDEVSQDFVEP